MQRRTTDRPRKHAMKATAKYLLIALAAIVLTILITAVAAGLAQ